MNLPETPYRKATMPLAFVAGLVIAAAACGNESINVLTPRDAAAETGTADASADESVDMPPAEDSPPLDGPASDAAVLDRTAIDGPLFDARQDDRAGDRSIADAPATDAPMTGCQRPGQQCSFAGQCCSLFCPLTGDSGGRTCSSDSLCKKVGESCSDNTDCCGNRCVSGGCAVADPVGRCSPAGESCTAGGDCCSGACLPLAPTGEPRCAPLDVCRAVGEVCILHTDCCSGQCFGAMDHFCVAAPPCGVGGNMCRGQAGDLCTSDAECCTGACTQTPGEPPRCAFSGSSCKQECGFCSEDRDCCSGQCLPDDGGGYRRCVNKTDF